MSAKLYKEFGLRQPVMVCGWAGIGKVGLVAINTMRRLVRAELLGEIEPQRFFNPLRVVIVSGLIEDMRFPATRFYGLRGRTRDAVFLVGEQQPGDPEKTYEMAVEVLDVAERLGCRRIYTAGAGVTTIHHMAKPKVWAVPNSPSLIPEIREYGNTILMSEIGGREGEGAITGLNGLLLGVAKSRDMEAVCLMGEVPYYLQGAPWPYPKASISVLEVLSEILGTPVDLRELHETAGKVEANINQVLEALSTAEELPEQVREEMEHLRYPPRSDLGPITEAEQADILEHIDELFKGNADNES
jgi:proteasome assembly chaperone (PAC2) family protein